jgi:hypothetical protein
MSNPSRFDRAELLSATGGWFFRNECLRPHLNVFQCEVRTKDEKGPLLPNTKVLLLLGKDAFDSWTGDKTNHTLGEIRGSIYYVQGIPSIPSYLPQDCMDAKDYEGEHNELLSGKDYNEPGDAGEKSEKRRHGVTARSNWRFWLQRDTEKAIRILLNDGRVPTSVGHFTPTYQLYPTAARVVEELREAKGKQLYLDLETDENFGLKCFGYSLDNSTITVVPVIDYQYKWAYPEVPEILRALSMACVNNTVISHNGAGFDWIVLSWKYNLHVGPNFYDTMLAQHRCYPDIEKSLGHCTSLWTYEPFHKDEGSMSYGTFADMRQLMQYCGKDVYTMMLIRRAIDAHAKTIPGLTESIAQVMASVPAYLLMTLTGIRYKQEMLDATMKENDQLMMHYINFIHYLIGDAAVKALNKKSKTSIPGSNAKCVHYFHDMLGYPVVARSKKTGSPSLAKKAIYKLRLKQENPVLDFVLAFRETQKESGSLKFTPWRQ